MKTYLRSGTHTYMNICTGVYTQKVHKRICLSASHYLCLFLILTMQPLSAQERARERLLSILSVLDSFEVFLELAARLRGPRSKWVIIVLLEMTR